MTTSKPPRQTPPRWAKRTLTAQAMGHTDPITKAVVPPIHIATTYLRDPDNQYTLRLRLWRPDNATVREAEGVDRHVGGGRGGARLLVRDVGGDRGVPGARAGRPRRRADRDVLGAAQLAAERRDALGPASSTSSTPADLDAVRSARAARARRSSSGSRRPPIRSGRSPTSPRPRRSRMRAGAKRGGRFDRGHAGVHPAARARRRHRDARGHQIPERPLRRGRRRARTRARTRSGRASRASASSSAAILGPFEA